MTQSQTGFYEFIQLNKFNKSIDVKNIFLIF